MKTSETILRRIIAITLICIFAFSITPSALFHNLLLAHEDHNVVHHHTHPNEIAKASINCHFNSFVCKTHFVILSAPLTVDPYRFSSASTIITDQAFYSQHHFFAELRGPPDRQA